MSSVKYYPRDIDPEIFKWSDLPQPITPEVEAAVRAATERRERFYRENPDAAEIDRRLNDELHEQARRFRDEEG